MHRNTFSASLTGSLRSTCGSGSLLAQNEMLFITESGIATGKTCEQKTRGKEEAAAGGHQGSTPDSITKIGKATSVSPGSFPRASPVTVYRLLPFRRGAFSLAHTVGSISVHCRSFIQAGCVCRSADRYCSNSRLGTRPAPLATAINN